MPQRNAKRERPNPGPASFRITTRPTENIQRNTPAPMRLVCAAQGTGPTINTRAGTTHRAPAVDGNSLAGDAVRRNGNGTRLRQTGDRCCALAGGAVPKTGATEKAARQEEGPGRMALLLRRWFPIPIPAAAPPPHQFRRFCELLGQPDAPAQRSAPAYSRGCR